VHVAYFLTGEEIGLASKDVGAEPVAGSDASDRSREDEDLARLKFAASTAEEAARWLRNSLARIRSGHEVEVEIRNAEKALEAALEVLRGMPQPDSHRGVPRPPSPRLRCAGEVGLQVLRTPHLSAGDLPGCSSYGPNDGG